MKRKRVTELLEAKNAESGFSDISTFISGFHLAAQIMVEVFHDKHNLFQ